MAGLMGNSMKALAEITKELQKYQINGTGSFLLNRTNTSKQVNMTEIIERITRLNTQVKHDVAYAMPKWIFAIVAFVAIIACGLIFFLLRDEYRQAQLRKKGYNKLPGMQVDPQNPRS